MLHWLLHQLKIIWSRKTRYQHIIVHKNTTKIKPSTLKHKVRSSKVIHSHTASSSTTSESKSDIIRIFESGKDIIEDKIQMIIYSVDSEILLGLTMISLPLSKILIISDLDSDVVELEAVWLWITLLLLTLCLRVDGLILVVFLCTIICWYLVFLDHIIFNWWSSQCSILQFWLKLAFSYMVHLVFNFVLFLILSMTH
jgi:hypothetical protein